MNIQLRTRLIYLMCLAAMLGGLAPPALAQDGKIFLPLVVGGSSGVNNAGFEEGYTGWGWYPGGTMLTQVYARSGAYSAVLGDGSHYRFAQITQQVVIPAASPYLVFYRRMTSSDICGANPYLLDYMAVTINNIEVFIEGVCANNSSSSWVRKSINLAGYGGQSVQLAFQFGSDSSLQSWLYVDDVQFGNN